MSEEYEDPKGGERRYEGDGPNLRYDDFVGRIVQDPNEPPDVTLLSGYLGSSSEEEHVRLYLDEGLSRYVEIPEKAILHTQELPPEQSPLGGSLVWIDSGAEVVHGAAGSERRRATFLEGQIAQDYMGGHDYGATGGITTQTRACVAIPQTITPACGAVSQAGPCIPKTEIAICRTLTGILCTRFGPFCRRTIFEPICTFAGPLCGHSVYYRCPTQNQSYCQESGFVGCNPEITIWEEQVGPHTVFERRIGGGGGFDPNIGVFETGFNCPSVFDNCATRESFCPSQLVVCQSQFGGCVTRSGCVSRIIRCPTTDIRCQTFTGPRCITRDCEFDTAVRCISRSIRCPTRGEPRCFASRSFACPDTAAGCQVDSAFCGFDPGVGGGGINRAADAAQGFEPMAFNMQQTQTPACYGGPPGHPTQHPGCPTVQTQTSDCVTTQTSACATGPVPTEQCVPNVQTQFCPSRVVRCPSAIDLCPTRVCPSQYTPCQSQFIRCPSALDACPTRFNCPSLPNGCPGNTRFGACETVGACPSAVDACPTRFGCFQTQVCNESIACFPGGGGGGFDPGGFGGGGGFGRGF